MKKVLSLTLVLLLLLTTVPFATFAISSNGVTMASISTDTATATLLDRTTGSTIALALLPLTGSAVLNGDTVEMTGLAPGTPYTLTVSETVTTNTPKEYSVDRRWVNASNKYLYFYVDDQNIEHEALLADMYYYLLDVETEAQMINITWYLFDFYVKGISTTQTLTTAMVAFETLPSLTIHTVGHGVVTPSSVAPYDKGETVTLTATPDTNWYFVSWSDTTSLALARDVIMDGNKEITATFATTMNNVLFISEDVTVQTTPVATGMLVEPFNVAPREGFVFAGWYNGELKFDFATPIIAPLTLTAKWLSPNMYFTVDNGLEVYHNGTLLLPIYTPEGGSYPWQVIKSYYANLQLGDVIAVKGIDEGSVAGFLGEIRINGVAYPTQANSFWKQTDVEQTGWTAKNFIMNEAWGPVFDKENSSWSGTELIGQPEGFDATWVWSENNIYSETDNHVVYFRYLVGGNPMVTFDSNGGNVIAPITVPTGTTFTGNTIAVPVPTKAGFTFTKWFFADTTTEFNALTIINSNIDVVAQYTPVTTEPTTEPTTQPVTQAPTVGNEPNLPVQPATTQPTTETVTNEDVPLGRPTITNFDSWMLEPNAVINTEPATEPVEVVEITTEETPLAGALPQTGQLPVELFFGVGGLITAAGIFLKRKN